MNSQDRLRLRRNPPNVSTPGGFDDLYFDAAGKLIHESPDNGLQEIGGGSASVTNESINAAIEDDPAATRDSLGLTNLDTQAIEDAVNSQPYTAAKIAGWTAGGGGSAPPVRMLILGDSLSAVGGGIKAGPNMGNAGLIGLSSYNRTGTVTLHAPPSDGRYDYWITGIAQTYAIGATGEYTSGGAATGDIRGDKACIGYIKGSGRGTFDLQYQVNGTGGWTTLATIDTSNASTIGAYAEYSLPTTNSPFYRLRVNNVTGGTVTIILTGIYNSNGGGVIEMMVGNISGLDIVNCLSTPSAVFTPIWTGLAPDIVVSLWADAASSWDTGGDFRTFYAAASAVKASTDWIQISRNPSYEAYLSGYNSWSTATAYTVGNLVLHEYTSGSFKNYRCTVGHTSGASTTPGSGASWATVWEEYYSPSAETASIAIANAQSASQRAWALETRQSFINGHELFGGSWSVANTRGLMGDVVHPSTAGATLRNMTVWDKTPVGQWYIGGGFKLAGNTADLNSAATSGNVEGQAMEFLRPITIRSTTGAINIFDRAAIKDGSRAMAIYPTGEKLFFARGNSNGGYFDFGSGLIGFYPGGNNWALGKSAERWKPFFAETNINGAIIAVPDSQTATTAAVSVTTPTTALTATAPAQAITLANGTHGQIKTIVLVATSGSGTAVLTPATKTGYTTVTFSAVGDIVTVQFFTSIGWIIRSIRGAVAA